MEKKKASSEKGAGLTGCYHVDEYKEIYIFHPAQTHVQVNQDLSIKPDTLDLIEKVGNRLKLIDTEDNFRNRTPTAQKLRPTINKWDLMKLKSFCKTKDTKR